MSFTLLSGIDEGLGTGGVSPAPSTERISSSESTTLSWNFFTKSWMWKSHRSFKLRPGCSWVFVLFLNMYVIEKLLKNNPGKLVASKDSEKKILSFVPKENYFPPNLPKWYNRVALKSSISGSGGSSHNGSCSAKSTAVSNWLRNSSWGQPRCRGKLHEVGDFLELKDPKDQVTEAKNATHFGVHQLKETNSFGSNEVYRWHAFSNCFQLRHKATTSPLWNKQGWWTIEHRPYRRKCNGPSWSSPHTLLISNTISMSLWQLFPRYSSSMLRLCVMGW